MSLLFTTHHRSVGEGYPPCPPRRQKLRISISTGAVRHRAAAIQSRPCRRCRRILQSRGDSLTSAALGIAVGGRMELLTHPVVARAARDAVSAGINDEAVDSSSLSPRHGACADCLLIAQPKPLAAVGIWQRAEVKSTQRFPSCDPSSPKAHDADGQRCGRVKATIACPVNPHAQPCRARRHSLNAMGQQTISPVDTNPSHQMNTQTFHSHIP